MAASTDGPRAALRQRRSRRALVTTLTLLKAIAAREPSGGPEAAVRPRPAAA